MKVSYNLILTFWVFWPDLVKVPIILPFGLASCNNKKPFLIRGKVLTSWSNSCKIIDYFSRISFTIVVKYFSVATDFVFYCGTKRSGILLGSSRVCCYFYC